MADNLPAKYAPKGIDIADLIEYRSKGLTVTEIAKLTGCDHSNVSRRLAEADLESLDRFETHKAKTFEHLQRRAVQNITDEELKKTTAAQRVWIAGVLQDKIAALRGQASQIVDHRHLVIDLGAAIQRLREEQQVDTSDTVEAEVIDCPTCNQ